MTEPTPVSPVTTTGWSFCSAVMSAVAASSVGATPSVDVVVRVLHEDDLVQVDALHGDGHRGDRRRVVEALGEAHVARGGLGQRVDLDRVAQGVRALDGAHERRQEDLLVADPAEVGAVADAVAGAQEGERLGALQGVLPGLDVQAGVRVGDVARDTDGNAADGVRHLDHAVELDDARIRDREAGELLHGQHGAGQPAVGERVVDLLVAHRVERPALGVGARRDGDEHVAGEADDGRVLVVGRDVQEHRHVVEVLAARAVGGVAVAAVASGEQHVEGAVDGADLRHDGLALGVDESDGFVHAAGHIPRRDGSDGDAADEHDAERCGEDLRQRGEGVAALELAVTGDRRGVTIAGSYSGWCGVAGRSFTPFQLEAQMLKALRPVWQSSERMRPRAFRVRRDAWARPSSSTGPVTAVAAAFTSSGACPIAKLRPSAPAQLEHVEVVAAIPHRHEVSRDRCRAVRAPARARSPC